MKIRALPKFEGIKDLERDVFPKAGDVWEVSEERANFLKSHGVIEFVEETPELTEEEKPYEAKIAETEKIEVKPISNKSKKHSKK
jgi:hypothetical protein